MGRALPEEEPNLGVLAQRIRGSQTAVSTVLHKAPKFSFSGKGGRPRKMTSTAAQWYIPPSFHVKGSCHGV